MTRVRATAKSWPWRFPGQWEDDVLVGNRVYPATILPLHANADLEDHVHVELGLRSPRHHGVEVLGASDRKLKIAPIGNVLAVAAIGIRRRMAIKPFELRKEEKARPCRPHLDVELDLTCNEDARRDKGGERCEPDAKFYRAVYQF